MALLQAIPAATAPWQLRAAGTDAPVSAVEARTTAFRDVLAFQPAVAPATPAAPLSFRCRIGRHRWLPLALSLAGAGRRACVSFCRDCPAVRRPDGH